MIHGNRRLLQAALSVTAKLFQKKQTAAGYMASAGKTGGEEKWAQAAMEYIYEKNHLNDGRKRQSDVDAERGMAEAFDRYSAVSEAAFEARLAKLQARMTESLEVMAALKLDRCLEEAVMLNTEQPPTNFRRPALTPPLMGYEPGFGLDVPQLKSQQPEYPPVRRPSDAIQFSGNTSSLALEEVEEEAGSDSKQSNSDHSGSDDLFPFVDAHQVQDLTRECVDKLEDWHDALREAVPLTGVEGEAWEAYVALQRKALSRQRLILDLCEDSELRGQYDADPNFRAAEWARRGLLPLAVEEEGEAACREEWHYAQTPAYQAFRK